MIVFDLDGTLSLVGDRVKYLEQSPKDWDSFYDHCEEDKSNHPVIEIFQCLDDCTLNEIKIVTGRRESVRSKTLSWLDSHGIFIESEDVIMRPDGDHRHDTILKPELVKDFIDDIEMVFEDRNSMVAKWRELGITCFQVAEGDF